jgi:hypothetical protein
LYFFVFDKLLGLIFKQVDLNSFKKHII